MSPACVGLIQIESCCRKERLMSQRKAHRKASTLLCKKTSASAAAQNMQMHIKYPCTQMNSHFTEQTHCWWKAESLDLLLPDQTWSHQISCDENSAHWKLISVHVWIRKLWSLDLHCSYSLNLIELAPTGPHDIAGCNWRDIVSDIRSCNRFDEDGGHWTVNSVYVWKRKLWAVGHRHASTQHVLIRFTAGQKLLSTWRKECWNTVEWTNLPTYQCQKL